MGSSFGKPPHPKLDKIKKSKGTDQSSRQEFDKTVIPNLNKLFEDVVTKVSIDNNNQEIQDIQSAVRIMLGRVVTRVNKRGRFQISRIQPCGSMAEQTAVWKYDRLTGAIYRKFPKYSDTQNICCNHSKI